MFHVFLAIPTPQLLSHSPHSLPFNATTHFCITSLLFYPLSYVTTHVTIMHLKTFLLVLFSKDAI